MNSLIAGIVDISQQMTQNFLQLNQDKIEILVIGAKTERERLSDHLKLFTLNTKEQVKNLSVIIESDLNFKCHLKNMT